MAQCLRVSFRLSAAVAAICVLPPSRADIVYLKNGNMVEGEVGPGSRPGTKKVTLDRGLEIEFPESEIREIEKKKSPAKEFDERLAAMAADDVDGLLELAEWARERKLRSKEEIVYKKVLEIDPDDPIARRELGYAVFKNRWVKESELKAKRGLVQFRGDWVTPEEKDRRLTEELKKEISDLFRDVDSDNQYIREYSVKKLMEYREPRVGKVALGFLTDPREAVRAVALQLLASIAAGGEAGKSAGKGPGGSKPAAGKAGGKTAGKSAPSSGPSEDEVCAAILDRALNEESRVVRTSLVNVLQKIHSRRLFDLALGVVETSANALHRDRAAEVVLYTLHKAWMDDLIAALGRRPKWSPTTGGNPQVRSILAKISREDFEYRVADWKGWWERNRHRFMDEE